MSAESNGQLVIARSCNYATTSTDDPLRLYVVRTAACQILGLRLMMGEFPADKAFSQLLAEATSGWRPIDCQRLFPRLVQNSSSLQGEWFKGQQYNNSFGIKPAFTTLKQAQLDFKRFEKLRRAVAFKMHPRALRKRLWQAVPIRIELDGTFYSKRTTNPTNLT
ncbi:hypothetical protein J6590_045152 [Homalodisca vitripennis]|nr:hypothetical protein J6590_045152 [Homalodisca vitripennis]